MTITAVVLCVIALALGAVAGWMVGSARKSAEVDRARTDREAMATEREAMRTERDGLRSERDVARSERDLAQAERQKSALARLELQRRVEEAQQARAIAEATAATRIAEAEKLLANHASMQKQIEDSFAALAQKAFKDVSENLVHANKTQVSGALDTKKVEIEALLTPMREMLESYRGEVLKSEQARNESYGGLQQQIRTLLTAQELSQREASRLANALQSPTVQGSWGELSLKRCIEMAGMSEYSRDFDTQQTFTSEEGKRLRPDVVVHLPNDRVIAVDAKAPLSDYIAACSESDEAKKRLLFEAHAKNIRRHVDTLAKKEYQLSIGNTLDFTVMFIPGEHFLSAALSTDIGLMEYATEKKIFLASPTILLPLLRAVAASWKAEKTEESAKKMHDSAVELFNRFVRVMDLFADIGSRLAKTVEKYNEAIRSIDTRLWPKGEELQRMAGSGKELGALQQIEAIPLESAKLRLTMQNEEPGVVVQIRD
ncbi:MAG TPA: DNA recombination protein RmuC [Thermoanaerobaculia bacterium]|nr:DNA recombination protein RmuC [Thermoanaerobaculia bacterium]